MYNTIYTMIMIISGRWRGPTCVNTWILLAKGWRPIYWTQGCSRLCGVHIISYICIALTIFIVLTVLNVIHSFLIIYIQKQPISLIQMPLRKKLWRTSQKFWNDPQAAQVACAISTPKNPRAVNNMFSYVFFNIFNNDVEKLIP